MAEKFGRCVVCFRGGSKIRSMNSEPKGPGLPICDRHFNELEAIGLELFMDKYDFFERAISAWNYRLTWRGLEFFYD